MTDLDQAVELLQRENKVGDFVLIADVGQRIALMHSGADHSRLGLIELARTVCQNEICFDSTRTLADNQLRKITKRGE